MPSAIVKTPVAVGPSGLAGDAQGDRKRHGGPDKAVHIYPVAHYTNWARHLPDRADLFTPGTFGENIVLAGPTEADVCIGDMFRLGSALVQLSQARQPCWKLNLRFGLSDMARRVQTSGRTGWYARVLAPGTVAAGDRMVLEARPTTRIGIWRGCSGFSTAMRWTARRLRPSPKSGGFPHHGANLRCGGLKAPRSRDWEPRLRG